METLFLLSACYPQVGNTLDSHRLSVNLNVKGVITEDATAGSSGWKSALGNETQVEGEGAEFW